MGSPLSVSSVRKVRLREINETVLVGTRMESAMKPTLLISGKISSRAMAAPVVVGIMLLKTDRFLRRSFVPDLGGASKMFWLFVAA